MKPKNWSDIHLKYPGQWIAFGLDQETVIANAHSLKNTLKKAKKQGFNKASVFKVPAQPLPYVGQS